MEREPWIKALSGSSVTELEIYHGALNNPQLADYAFMYFRDPHFIETFSPEKQSEFIETPSQADIQLFGMEEATRRASERKNRLLILKEQIRTSGLHVRENFNSPQQLGEWIQSDLTKIIDTLYPQGSQLTALEREIREHESFAASRTQVYVGGENTSSRLKAMFLEIVHRWC